MLKLPKWNLTTPQKMLIILLAIALIVSAGVVVALSFVLTPSDPVTYTSNPTSTPTPSPTPAPTQVKVNLELSASSGYTDQPLMLKATVANSGANGLTVTFYDGATVVGSAVLVGGSASIVLPSVSVGTHTYTAGP